MLIQISLSNFAVFNNVTVNLNDDFTVITGESGSGKSVLINALSLINGARAYKEMIRNDCEYATIEAVFKLSTSQKQLLKDLILIENNEDLLVITRRIHHNQKSECRINGKIRNLSSLTEITSKLLDIHGQYENQSLLNQENHFKYIDIFAKIELETVLNKFQNKRNDYIKLVKEVSSVSGTLNERERDKEIYQFQIDDINDSHALEYNWKEIFEQKKLMDDHENIKLKLSNSLSLFDNEDKSVCDLIYEAAKTVENSMESKITKEISENLFNSYYIINDSIKNIEKLLSDIDYDEVEYENIGDLVNDINKIKSKYGNTKEDVTNYLYDVNEKLAFINNFEKIQKEHIKEIEKLEKELLLLDNKMTEIRQKFSKKLEKSVEKHISELEMKNAKFTVDFKQIKENNVLGYTKFNENGNDVIEFFIATLKGSKMMPLKRIASGGEMSRIMLALKTTLADHDQIQTVIFDEIDTGISGQTAKVAAIKLKNLATLKQVICITHSPQIIAKGKHHYVINKNDEQEMTTAYITYLDDFEKRIFELAKIIDGNKVTNEGLEHAKELLIRD